MTLSRLLTAKYFVPWTNKIIPYLFLLLIPLLIYSVIGALYLAPSDYQQGEAFRIIYIHVPSAFLSLLVYLITAMMAGLSLIFRIKLCELWVEASLRLGAWFTVLALLTGAIWGKPMWGTWWVWGARLTSELILLFLYLGVMALKKTIPEPQVALQTSSLLLLLGLVNLPIIHYSVYWWHTLHQGTTLRFLGPPLIARPMLYPLLTMILVFILYYLLTIFLTLRVRLIQ